MATMMAGSNTGIACSRHARTFRAAIPQAPVKALKARATSTVTAAAVTAQVSTAQKNGAKPAVNEHDLTRRHQQVQQYFPTALGVDDFIARVETTLSGYGFTGDNSIAMTNLCRDEVTSILKDKIESTFGSSFNTNGLGGVLTCGATGMGAGLSHSPTCSAGRERYVFFSFPHIAIDGQGEVGSISRPGRAGRSCACGALAKCLGEFKNEGFVSNCKVPGVHDPLDPEYSILKQRLARRLRHENTDLNTLTLASITAVAERTITNDLEYLIEKAVDTNKADYAVVTGVQIHNWATELDGHLPSMEFVAPTKVFVVMNGVKINLDLTRVPPLSPRQLMLLASSKGESAARSASGVLQEVPFDYLAKRMGGATLPMKRTEPAQSNGKWMSSAASPTKSDPAQPVESIEQDFKTSFFAKDNTELTAADIAFLEQALAAQEGGNGNGAAAAAPAPAKEEQKQEAGGLGGWLQSIWGGK